MKLPSLMPICLAAILGLMPDSACVTAAATISTEPLSPLSILIGDATIAPSPMSQILELPLTITATSDEPVCLAGFQMTTDINGPDAALQFVGVDVGANSTYPFAPSSPSPLVDVAADGQRVTIGDFLDSGFAAVEQDSFELILRILIPGVSQPNLQLREYSVHVLTDENETFFAQSPTAFFPYFAFPGKITTGVPEPSTAALLLLAGLLALRRASRFGDGATHSRWKAL